MSLKNVLSKLLKLNLIETNKLLPLYTCCHSLRTKILNEKIEIYKHLIFNKKKRQTNSLKPKLIESKKKNI